jgi:hypothetical protein
VGVGLTLVAASPAGRAGLGRQADHRRGGQRRQPGHGAAAGLRYVLPYLALEFALVLVGS